MKKKALIIFILLLAFQSLKAQKEGGSLVIVGGGLEPDNSSVYSRMIELAGGANKATFAVIPSASGVAMQSFVLFKSTLISYGVKPENISLIEIAMVDDDSTTNIDESQWKNNGSNAEYAEKIRKCTCVWFTGGDQLRTTKTLYNPDGSYTPVLKAVWDVYNQGGVIAGSSAGAAIMSDPMIGDGNSMDALVKGVSILHQGQDSVKVEGVLIARGLGFFPAGLADQHFEARGRLGRIIVAMNYLHDKYQMGFGIDENTALIYLSRNQTIEVAGVSGVTIINTKSAVVRHGPLTNIENILIHYLTNGDVYDLKTGIIKPASDKIPIAGKEKYNQPQSYSGGLFADSPSFRDLITTDLIDNKACSKTQSIAFYEEGKGFMITFSKTSESFGYVSAKKGQARHYTAGNIKMDIKPVNIKYIPTE